MPTQELVGWLICAAMLAGCIYLLSRRTTQDDGTLSLHFSAVMTKHLEALRRHAGARTKRDVVLRALALYETLHDYKDRGYTVVLTSKDEDAEDYMLTTF